MIQTVFLNIKTNKSEKRPIQNIRSTVFFLNLKYFLQFYCGAPYRTCVSITVPATRVEIIEIYV